MLSKQHILTALGVWIRQRPGLEFGNYGEMSSYRAELRQITKDRHDAESLLTAVALRDSITQDDLLKAFPRAFSGRLSISETKDGKARLDYCAGQYWPTEYRKAAAAVLASALWDWMREECMPKPQGYCVECFEDTNGRGLYGRTRASSKTWTTREEAQAYADTVAKSRNPGVHEIIDGVSPGDWLRNKFRREFGRSIQTRWFS